MIDLFVSWFYSFVIVVNGDMLYNFIIFVLGVFGLVISVLIFLVGKNAERYRLLKMCVGVVGSSVMVMMILSLFLNSVIVDHINKSENELLEENSEFFETFDDYSTVLSLWPNVYYAFRDGELSDDEMDAFETVDTVVGTNSYEVLKGVELLNSGSGDGESFEYTEEFNNYVENVREYLVGDTYEEIKEVNNEYMIKELKRVLDQKVLTDYDKEVAWLVYKLFKVDGLRVLDEDPYFHTCDDDLCYVDKKIDGREKINRKYIDAYVTRFTDVDVNTTLKNKLILANTYVIQDSLEDGVIDDYETDVFKMYDEVYGTDVSSVVKEFSESKGSNVVKKKLSREIAELELELL